MNKLLSVLILNSSFFIINCFSQSWYVINPSTIPESISLTDVFFTNENTGWITTSTTNNIFKTVDGAASFSTETTPLGATQAIQMLDASNGYSGGAGGWIYKTDDGGLNWNILASMGNLTDISFPPNTDPNNPVGYASGDSGRVWEITSTLTDLNSGSASHFSGISAPSVNNVWVCGGGHIFYYNGATFYDQTTPSGTFNDIHFINNQEGWVVGNSGVIGHTTDGGVSWITQTNPDTQNRALYGVFFLDSDQGWAVGNGGVILHTTNGGTTWTEEGAGLTTAFLRGVHFTSSTNGYVVGNSKTLIKYGMPLATEDENGLPIEFFLSQNYPNPFNPATKINFNLTETGFTTLKVFDISGKEIVTLVEDNLQKGSYEFGFNAITLNSGIYFYQLTVDNNVETKKMVLMK